MPHLVYLYSPSGPMWPATGWNTNLNIKEICYCQLFGWNLTFHAKQNQFQLQKVLSVTPADPSHVQEKCYILKSSMGFSKTQHQFGATFIFLFLLLTAPTTFISLGNSMTEKRTVYRYVRIDDILSALLSPIFVGGITLFFGSEYVPKSTSAFSSCPQPHFRKCFMTGDHATCCQVATVILIYLSTVIG
jgi:hypothetical protein